MYPCKPRFYYNCGVYWVCITQKCLRDGLHDLLLNEPSLSEFGESSSYLALAPLFSRHNVRQLCFQFLKTQMQTRHNKYSECLFRRKKNIFPLRPSADGMERDEMGKLYTDILSCWYNLILI